jgi:hypothetical protein
MDDSTDYIKDLALDAKTYRIKYEGKEEIEGNLFKDSVKIGDLALNQANFLLVSGGDGSNFLVDGILGLANTLDLQTFET